MNTIIVTTTCSEGMIYRLQFNLWNSSVNKLKFLDIGISCSNDNQTITIKLPQIQKPNVEDLSGKIDAVVANAIFNCFVSLTSSSDGVKEFYLDNSEDRSILSSIDTSSCISKDGNEIKIRVEKQQGKDIKKQYYRFRITNYDFASAITKKESKSRFFESSFSASEIIDFRVNDIKLADTIQSKVISSSKTKFGKIHFLYITDLDVDVDSSDCSSRFLERTIWDNYLNLNKRAGDMIAYHLKTKDSSNPVSNASFLLKSRYNKTSRPHLLLYGLIIIFFAVVGNFLTDVMRCLLKLPCR